MKMVIHPWPEVAAYIQKRFGYVDGQDYEMSGEALHALVAAGYDIMVRQAQVEVGGVYKGFLTVSISPGGRGFGQR